MAFAEEDLLPISALQHLLFCERQCALIHVEQVWRENVLTAEGRILHDNVHTEGHETRKSVRSVRALQLRSLVHGLAGVADLVEFHAPSGEAARILSTPGFWMAQHALRHWRIIPIEYKRGRPKTSKVDEVQLCAQALCLEEMVEVQLEEGFIFYGEERRRVKISFTPDLRALTIGLCARLRSVLGNSTLPRAVERPCCKQCSLVEICMPATTSGHRSVHRHMHESIDTSLREAFPIDD